MPHDVQLDRGGADLARAHFDAICHLYDEVFSAPPFFWRDDESELHRERLESLLSDPTFGIVTAHTGDELVGFAYGFTLPADTKRWGRLTEPLPKEITEERPGRTFVLFDYAVKASHRGQGTGKLLHDALLSSRSEERATLTVQPTATDTHAIYAHWGWRRIGEMAGGPTAAAPRFDVFLRDRLEDLTPTSPEGPR